LWVYYGLDLLLSKLSKAQSNGQFRECNIQCRLYRSEIIKKPKIDTAEKLFTGVNDTANKFFGGVNDTGD
jgi:hypothetical protein